jgi:phosphocarrier protein HPr
MEKIMVLPKKPSRAKGSFVVMNIRGIHTRPATEIVKFATRYKASIKLFYRNAEANAKSLLSILMLAAEMGAKIRVEAEGEDAVEALNAMVKLAKDQFNMSY